MQDLHLTYRYSYALLPRQAKPIAAGVPLIVNDAHRAMRNAVAIATVLNVPSLEAERAIGRIEEAVDAVDTADVPWRAPVMAPSDAAILLTLAGDVIGAYKLAFDPDGRPGGRLGRFVEQEIAANTNSPSDGVFALGDDGTVDLRYPRMTLGDVERALEAIVVIFRFAFAHRLDIVVCPAVWGATEIDPEWVP